MQTFKEFYQKNFEGDEQNKALLPKAEEVYRLLRTSQAILDFSDKPSVEQFQRIPSLESYDQVKYYHILGYAIRYAMYVEKESKGLVQHKVREYQRV